MEDAVDTNKSTLAQAVYVLTKNMVRLWGKWIEASSPSEALECQVYNNSCFFFQHYILIRKMC